MKNVIVATAIALLIYVAAMPYRVNDPIPVAAQEPPKPATADLQATIDAQATQITALQRTQVLQAAAIEKIESRRTADPATKTLAELGCRPNDPTFDNVSLIQPALDAGYNLDVDAVYYTSPLKTPVGVPAPDGKLLGRSCVIAGQGAGYRHGGKGVTGFVAFKPDQPCIIECPGTASPGQCMVIRDLHLEGNAADPKCDGIRVYGARNTSIENVVIRNCGGRAIAVEPKVGVYCLSVRNSSLLNNGTGLDLRNGTSVCCFAMYSTEIIGGTFGVVVTDWRRGAVFTSVAIEGQADTKWRIENGRATLVGNYHEGDANKIGILAVKGSRVTIIDTSAGGHKVSGDSQINWIGDNNQAGTIGWGQ